MLSGSQGRNRYGDDPIQSRGTSLKSEVETLRLGRKVSWKQAEKPSLCKPGARPKLHRPKSANRALRSVNGFRAESVLC